MTIDAVLVIGPPGQRVRRQLDGLAAAVTIHETRRHGEGVAVRALERLWRENGVRATSVLVIDRCGDCPIPDGPVRATPDGAQAALTTLRRDVERGQIPAVPEDPAWSIVVRGVDATLEHMHDTWLVMVDGVVGTLGSPLTGYVPARREVLVAGVYSGTGPDSDLLRSPDWTRLAGALMVDGTTRRVLDLRSGFVHHEAHSTIGRFRAVTFASRALPGVGVLRAMGPGARPPRGPLLAPDDHGSSVPPRGAHGGVGPDGETDETRLVAGIPGGAAIAASQDARGRAAARRLDRLAAHLTRADARPSVAAARGLLRRAEAAGVDSLMRQQRALWARRWEEMGIRIDGDPDLQRAVNFALFHLDASIAPGARQAPLGPRGLSGPSYKGHVFWDSEIFLLPFFAATRPSASRAMLAYRVSRLGAAKAAAREAGLKGAWFPWESAADGRDVTPPWVTGPTAQPLRVWTGERELHIVADIAWAAAEHVAWSGDEAFAQGGGRRLLIETARFWASRMERDADGRVHLRGIIGPDEYHELVDDNAYTNVMARWNLRAAAAAVGAGRGGRSRRGESGGGRSRETAEPTRAEVADWLDVADRIVDGYDPRTRIYEQFAGFHGLEPIRIADLASRPAWADVLLGRERVARAQVVKQTDVLLLHHLVPDEVVEASLAANLDYYEPRTAHGSSLSPATHAGLLARAGRFAPALEALRVAAFFDLDDRNGTASEGLHVQSMGGLWQALVMGFGGIRPAGDALTVDPHLPPEWTRLEIPVRFRGHHVRVTIEPGTLHVRSRTPVPVRVAGLASQAAGPSGLRFTLRDGQWSPTPSD
jgi:hypothetical protein